MSNFTTWRSLVDGEEILAIPDSAIAQFLPSNYDTGQDAWPDEIGGVGDLTEGTGITAVLTDEQNGEDLLDFDDDRVEASNVAESINQPYTAIFGAEVTDNNDSSTVIDSVSTDDDRTLFQLRYNDNDYRVQSDSAVSIGSEPTSDFAIFSVHFEGPDTEVRVNGISEGTADAGTSGIESFRIGQDAAEGNPAMMRMGELMVYEGLSDDDRDSEEQRLADKYGVALA